MTIDRRALLKALSAAAAAALAARALAALAQAPSAAQFGKLAAALTGYPEPDAATAAKMLRAFATPQRRAALAALADVVAATPAAELDAALAARRLDGVANDLVAAWFSGIVTDGTRRSLVLYTDAYVWTAMTFSKPMGVCGGPTGYWAEPPQ